VVVRWLMRILSDRRLTLIHQRLRIEMRLRLVSHGAVHFAILTVSSVQRLTGIASIMTGWLSRLRLRSHDNPVVVLSMLKIIFSHNDVA
jgi:hypothetical protein